MAAFFAAPYFCFGQTGQAATRTARQTRNLLAERDRWFPWGVAAFATGAATYFALPFEPSVQVALMLAAAGWALLLASRRNLVIGLRFLCILVACAGSGFGAAKLRTETIAAPSLRVIPEH